MVQRLNSSSTVVSTQKFDAFGKRISTDSNTDLYAGFGGQYSYYTDWETGMELLTYRYFDTVTGRFLTRDPSSYSGGINLYEYCGNGPTTNYDPIRLECLGQAILNAIAGFSTTFTYLFDILFFGGHQKELSCDEVSNCIGAIAGAFLACAFELAAPELEFYQNALKELFTVL